MYVRGGGSFTNQGVLSVTSGELFDARSVVFTNASGSRWGWGRFDAADWLRGGQLLEPGTITLGAVRRCISGSFSQTDFGAVSNSGGTVFIDGTLANSGTY